MHRLWKPGRFLRPLACGCGVLLAASLPGIAQRYSFREYTQGLRNLNITSLVQDQTGFLWVGTQNGLYRYDGAQFQGFGEAQGLPERTIVDLYVGPDGTLWAATTAGIYFERRDGQFAQVQELLPGNQFQPVPGSFFTSNDPNTVVTMTRGGALMLRRTGDETWAASSMHLDGGKFGSALYTPDGALWYGCDSDLCRFAGGKTMRMRAKLGLPEDNWASLLLTRNGSLWIRGNFHVGAIDPNTLQFKLHDLPGAATSEAYPTLAEDEDGKILTAQGPSLAMWEKGHWQMVTEENGLSRFQIQNLYVDREGSVWLGVVGHGLKRWVGQDRWEGYTAADGLSDDLVWATVRDREGRLWIGTESGLDWIPSGESTPRVWKRAGIVSNRAGTLAAAADGSIWMGSAAGTLVRIDPKTLAGREWKLPEVFKVAVDSKTVWAATNNGLFKMDLDSRRNKPVRVKEDVFGNSQQRFSDLCIDATGRIWTVADEGIFLHDGLGWHRIDPNTNSINANVIAIDQQGYVWVAGAAQEVMRLRIDGYRVTEAKHIGRPPLLSQQVVSLLVDSRGWLWAGQDAGLSVFDGHAWRGYTQDDGLLWNDTDSFALNEDSDHSIWIGTSGGLSHLMTPQNAPMGLPQPPAFSKVTYGNKVLGNGSSIKWGSRSLDISMAQLSFRGTQDAGLRYRLVGGQGSDWVETRDMVVHLQHLTPGSYSFEVAEADQAGHPISPVATFSFKLIPLWWQSRDLQITLALMGSVVLVATWKQRMGALVKQKRQLEAAVKLRTIDLEKEKGELTRTKEQMRHFAEHDDLTGLWNHRIIVERLRIEVERSKREGLPVSIILADLDYFKRINDTYGHPAGDQVLKEASATFQRMVRTYDWVGRYGGEEFLLILPGSGHVHAKQRADELRAAIQNTPMREGEHTIDLTASFGVASGFPSSHEDLIREADEALYRAKNNGRNCVVATEIDTRKAAIHRVS